MAEYSYAALSVRVAANTSELTKGVHKAAEDAGADASATMGRHIGKGLGGAAKAVGGALTSVVALAGAGVAGLAVESVKAGLAYNKVYDQGMRAFKAVLGTDKAAQGLMESVSKLAEVSPFPKEAFIAATQQMLAFGFKAKDVVPTLSAVQNAVAATGKGAEGMSAVTQALGRVQETGKFTARTFTTLSKNGIDAVALMAKGMGVSTAQVLLDVKSKTFDSQKALSVLTAQMAIQYKGAAAQVNNTWAGAKNHIEEAMIGVGSAIAEPFIGKGGGGLAVQWANKFAELFDKLAPMVTPLVNALMQSLAPAIAAVNKGFDHTIAIVEKLADPKHLPAATEAVKKYGAAGLALGSVATTFAGLKLFEELPVVGGLLEGLTKPFEKVTEKIGEVAKATAGKSGIGKWLGLGGEAEGGEAAAAALSGPLVAIVAAVGLVVAASPKLRTALLGFGKGLIAAVVPIVKIVIAGVKSLIPPVMQVAKTIGDNLAPIVAKLIPLLAPLGKILGTVLAIAFRILGAELKVLAPILGWVINLIGKLLLGALNLVLPPVIAIVTWISNRLMPAFQAVVKWATPVVKVIGVDLVNAVKAAARFLSTAWGVAVSAIKITFAVIGTIIDVWWILVKAIFSAWWLVVSTIGKMIWSVIGKPVTAAWNAILKATRAVWGAVSGAVSTAWTAVRRAVSSALGWIKGTVSAAWGWVASNASKAWGSVAKVIGGVWAQIKRAIGAALGWIKGVISDAWTAVLNVGKKLWGLIDKAISAVWDDIKNTVIGRALTWIANKISGVWNDVLTATDKIWGQISGAISKAWDAITTAAGKAGGDIISGLWGGFTTALKDVGKWINDHVVQPIIGAIKSHFGIKSPSTVMAALGGQLLAGLFKGLTPANWLKTVERIFGGLPQALASLIGKGLVDLSKVPAAALKALGGLGSKLAGFFGGLFGGGGSPTVKAGSGVQQWSATALQALTMLGRPDLLGLTLAQMQTESGGNPAAINLWDSNAKAGHPSQGLMQVIPSTFAAYAGPLRSRGILDPLANIYAAMAYAIARYGRSIGAVLGHGHGYAAGGIISEPVSGVGQWSGQAYSFAESGAEAVLPASLTRKLLELLKARTSTGASISIGPLPELLAPAAAHARAAATAHAKAEQITVAGKYGAVTINVYPQKGQSETEIAAAVNRALVWAAQGGRK